MTYYGLANFISPHACFLQQLNPAEANLERRFPPTRKPRNFNFVSKFNICAWCKCLGTECNLQKMRDTTSTLVCHLHSVSGTNSNYPSCFGLLNSVCIETFINSNKIWTYIVEILLFCLKSYWNLIWINSSSKRGSSQVGSGLRERLFVSPFPRLYFPSFLSSFLTPSSTFSIAAAAQI